MYYLINTSKKIKNVTTLFLSYFIFQFSFIGCTNFEDNIEPIQQNDQESVLTSEDLELVDLLSESFNLSLDQSFEKQKQFKSLSGYTNFIQKRLEYNLTNSIFSKNFSDEKYFIKMENVDMIEKKLEEWAIDFGTEIDQIDENEFNFKKIIAITNDSYKKHNLKILQGELAIEDKRVALILLNTFTNFSKSTILHLAKIEKTNVGSLFTNKCNFWKKAKWIIKCTALTGVAAGACGVIGSASAGTGGAAAVFYAKCIVALVKAAECWEKGC